MQTELPSIKPVVRSLEDWETLLSRTPKRSKLRTEEKIAAMRIRSPMGVKPVETLAGISSVTGFGLEATSESV
jgi:hypothetical protein